MNDIFEKYREEQLWGKKLQNDTKNLLSLPELESVIKKAQINSDFANES